MNKLIAKNTIFLYTRMIVMILVSLYTSRVILMSLGINDYGLYQTIAGIVALVSFINSAMASGTSRFLIYELGKGNIDRMKAMFSTLLITHIFLAIIIIFFGEIIGLWLISYHLNIFPDQINTAKIIYQFSLITVFMNITQVPYSAIIIAHENMKIYAYLSFIEVIFKLIISYVIGLYQGEKLLVYAALLCLIQVIIISIYRFYCRKNYNESKLQLELFEKSILVEVSKFSCWSLLSTLSVSMITYGTTILLSIFFSPALVASRYLTGQVNTVVNQLIQNFCVAVNPQIIKRYANKDYEGAKKLLLVSSRYSFYLILLVALPVYLLSEPLLLFWLGDIPEYAVVFLQWSMVQSIFSVFDILLYTALYANGRLKENALIAPLIDIIAVFVVYFAFLWGYTPDILCYVYVVIAFIQGIIEKPLLLYWLMNYKIKDFYILFMQCILVLIVSIPIPIIFSKIIDLYTFINFVGVIIVSVFCVLTTIFFIGMRKDEKQQLISWFKSKFNIKRSVIK